MVVEIIQNHWIRKHTLILEQKNQKSREQGGLANKGPLRQEVECKKAVVGE